MSALGTYLVLYTSLIPFSNNILEAFYPDIKTTLVIAAKNNLSAVIWSLGMCLQPTIFIVTLRMKPYLWAYSLPLFTSIYSTSFYVLPLFGLTPKENVWFFISIIAIVAIILCLIKGINFAFKVAKSREEQFIKSFEANRNRKNI